MQRCTDNTSGSLTKIKFFLNGILINTEASKCLNPNLLNQVQQAIFGGRLIQIGPQFGREPWIMAVIYLLNDAYKCHSSYLEQICAHFQFIASLFGWNRLEARKQTPWCECKTDRCNISKNTVFLEENHKICTCLLWNQTKDDGRP